MGPFSPPSATTVFTPLGGRIGGSNPFSTRGIRKNGSSHLETRPCPVFPLFRPLFPAFYGPTHPHMRPLRAVGCENGGQGEGNPPGSGAVLKFPELLTGRRSPPKHGASSL
eukprot:scaffold45126_cov55-Phaeocystis_antarctica.AAC.3